MDSTGQTLLIFALVILIAGIVGFSFLASRGPKGATLGVAVLLYLGSYGIDDGDSRMMHGMIGVFRMLGFIGLILGVIALFRGPRNPEPR